MPSGKQIAWIIGLSLLSTLALEHYRAKGGSVVPMRRAS